MSKKKSSVRSEEINAGLPTERRDDVASAFLKQVNAASPSVSDMRREHEEAVRFQGYPAGLPGSRG